MRKTWAGFSAVAIAVLLVFSAGARASWIPGDGAILITITATSGDETAEYNVHVPPGLIVSGHYDWELPGQAQMHGQGGAHLGIVQGLLLGIDADPGVSLGFLVQANMETEWTITSSVVSFDPIVWPLAYASAGVTVTDNNGDGATLTGLFDDGSAYEARYNAAPVTWTGLLDAPMVALPDDSQTVNDRRPASGREVIYATISSIQSQWKFSLTPGDSASGTSRFDVIVPEPATLAFFGLGGLIVLAGRLRRTGR